MAAPPATRACAPSRDRLHAGAPLLSPVAFQL